MNRRDSRNRKFRRRLWMAAMAVVALSATLQAALKAEDPEQEAKLTKLPQGVPLVSSDFSAYEVKQGGKWAKVQPVTVEGMPFRQALRIDTTAAPKEDANLRIQTLSIAPVKHQDAVLITFYARAVAPPKGEKTAEFNLTFCWAVPPWSGSVNRTFSLNGQWRKYYVSFPAVVKDKSKPKPARFLSQAGEQRIVFDQNFGPQIVEIADLKAVNYGETVKVSDLPLTSATYEGREPDAAWRKAALARIEKIRKADLVVKVVDEAGQPVPDAEVQVKMTRHAFAFGTAVAGGRLFDGNNPDNEKYRENLLKMFNRGVLGSETKMAPWRKDRAGPVRAINWMLEHGLGVRGHTLVWPSWRKNPPALKPMKDDPAALRKAIADHIADVAGVFKGCLVEWDVMNESYASDDWIKLLGEKEMVQWFKLARQADPHARLFINENRIVSSIGGGIDTPKHEYFYKTIQYLIDNGAPLDGIGLQGHSGWHRMMCPENILKVLDRLAAFRKEIEITEFDYDVSDEKLQADFVRDFLIAVFSHPSVTGFVMWGFWDGQHDVSNAPLFREDWTLKPSGQAYVDLVFRQWWMEETAKADATGALRTRGFLGQYDIAASAGGKSGLVQADLGKDGATIVVTLGRQQRREVPPFVPIVDPGLPESVKAARVAAAGPPQVRLDVIGVDEMVPLKLLSASKDAKAAQATWLPGEKKECFLFVEAPLTADAWTETTLKFTPLKDGTLTLKLKGEFRKKGEEPVWVYYDDITVEGAELQNGNFEQDGGKGRAAGWPQWKKGAEYVKNKSLARTGNACVKVCHESAIAQPLRVKAQQPVTIVFHSKAAEPPGEQATE